MQTPDGRCGGLLLLLPLLQTSWPTAIKKDCTPVPWPLSLSLPTRWNCRVSPFWQRTCQCGQINVGWTRGRPQGGTLQFLDFMFDTSLLVSLLASQPASSPRAQRALVLRGGACKKENMLRKKHWKLSILFFPQVSTQIINAHWPTWCSNFQLQVTERRALLQWDCRETTAQRKHQNHSLGVCSDFKLIASPALDVQIS